jgi:hypothetical protein
MRAVTHSEIPHSYSLRRIYRWSLVCGEAYVFRAGIQLIEVEVQPLKADQLSFAQPACHIEKDKHSFIRILAPIIGIKRKKDEEAEKDVTRQNTRVLEAETFLFARAALPGDALYKGLLPQTWPLRRSSLRGPLRRFCRLP